MAAGVIFVRHALPAVQRKADSRLWRLDHEAVRLCEALGSAIGPSVAPIAWTSGETKAVETAEAVARVAGMAVRVDGRLSEVRRPRAWVEDYRVLAVGYLARDEPTGWEPAAAVGRRFGAGVAAAIEDAPGGTDVVVVGHGLALSIYLAGLRPVVSHGGVEARFDVVAFWRELTFPDAWRLDVAANRLSRVFAGGTDAPDA